MAWNPGVVQDILTRARYYTGRVGAECERAIIEAVRDNQPAMDFTSPAFSSVTNANSTAQTLRSSTGRLYFITVENTDDDEIVVVLTDGGNTIIVGGVIVPAQIAAVGAFAAQPGRAKVAWFAAQHAAGQRIITDLRVRAFKSVDGTTPADNGCTVIALTSA